MFFECSLDGSAKDSIQSELMISLAHRMVQFYKNIWQASIDRIESFLTDNELLQNPNAIPLRSPKPFFKPCTTKIHSAIHILHFEIMSIPPRSHVVLKCPSSTPGTASM